MPGIEPGVEPGVEIVALSARPELVTEIAPWIWREWGRERGETLAQVTAGMAAKTALLGPEQCHVLLEDGRAVATRRDFQVRQARSSFLKKKKQKAFIR